MLWGGCHRPHGSLGIRNAPGLLALLVEPAKPGLEGAAAVTCLTSVGWEHWAYKSSQFVGAA